MMASFKTVLLLFIGLQAFALTSSVKPDDTRIDQEALKKPEQFCETLKACDSSKMYMPLSYYARACEANFFMCTVCETVIKTVEGLLSSHRTEKAVAEALKKACHILPFGMAGLCERMVGKYSKELIHLLLENAQPRTVCSAIHMCRLFEESFVEKCETCSPRFSGFHDDAL